MSHCEKVLAVLADGKPHSTAAIYREAGGMVLHSRIADLRKRGHDIVCERMPGLKGPEAFVYTWLDAPEQAPPVRPSAKQADYMERYDERQRFRPMRVEGREVEQIAMAGCPTEAGIVPMLVTLHMDGEFLSSDAVGVLDTDNWRLGKPGRWLISPFEGMR